jgi:hypothetical protein
LLLAIALAGVPSLALPRTSATCPLPHRGAPVLDTM